MMRVDYGETSLPLGWLIFNLGDIRYSKETRDHLMSIPALQKPIDHLFLDATFCDPMWSVFPSQVIIPLFYVITASLFAF